MNDDANGVVQAAEDEDLVPTLRPARPGKWRMPEPVFRKTSGRLPAGFERNYGVADANTAEPASENDPPATGADNADASNSYIEPKPKNPTLKLILVLLGLVVMIAFIAVFLTVVYFFFLR